MTELRTSEVLNLAADLIEERGWATGVESWAQSGQGLCIEGGVIAAAGLNPAEAIGHIHTCPAYRAVMEHIGEANIVLPPDVDREYGLRLWMWNDEVNPETGDYLRTAAEVIATLRAVALIEAAREDATLMQECGR